MTQADFEKQRARLSEAHESLIRRQNQALPENNGWFQRYRYPVLTGAHTPPFWRYDLNFETNPFLMERMGINGVFNVGAMKWNGKIVLMGRVEGNDRKSFFAVAESTTGVDGFRFWDY